MTADKGKPRAQEGFNPFYQSRVPEQHLETPNATDAQHARIWVEHERRNPLIDLVNEYGKITLEADAEHKGEINLKLDNGQIVRISQQTNLLSISLLSNSTLSFGAAELMTRVLNILSNERDDAAKLDAQDAYEEEVLWRALVKAERKIKANNQNQLARFKKFTERLKQYAVKHATHFGRKMQLRQNNTDNDTQNPSAG